MHVALISGFYGFFCLFNQRQFVKTSSRSIFSSSSTINPSYPTTHLKVVQHCCHRYLFTEQRADRSVSHCIELQATNLATRRTSNQWTYPCLWQDHTHHRVHYMGERCLHVSTGAEACLEFDPVKIQNKRLQMDIR